MQRQPLQQFFYLLKNNFMLKKGSAAAKAFMAKIRAAKGKKKVSAKKTVVKKVGALPVGFEGKIFETTFKIINQFDIFNNVQSIVEDKKNGSTITVFDGKGNAADKAKQFANYVENYAYPDSRLSESDYKALYGKILKFSQNMQNEVKEYNKGSKKTIKKQPLNIPAPAKKKAASKKAAEKKSVVKKQTGFSNKFYDQMYQAKGPGKRKSASGRTYYESRANRSDKGKLLGVAKDKNVLKDFTEAVEKIKLVENEILSQQQVLKKTKENDLKKILKDNINYFKKYLTELKKHKTELKKLL